MNIAIVPPPRRSQTKAGARQGAATLTGRETTSHTESGVIVFSSGTGVLFCAAGRQPAVRGCAESVRAILSL